MKAMARAMAVALAGLLIGLMPSLAEAAPRGIEIGFSDQSGFVDHDADVRAAAFGESVRAGARYARIGVRWSGIERADPIDPTNPEDPAYYFERRLDNAVRDADRRGLTVIATIHSAPPWAEGPDRPTGPKEAPPGTWDPDPERLRLFAEAVARRYDGSYVPPGDIRPLPEIDLYEAWNEPNLSGFLTPQWIDTKRSNGPELYRSLLNAVYDGVKAVQPGATVIAGSTGPSGGVPGRRRVNPLRFFRELFCLSFEKRPQGKPCPEPARFDLLSHHPINPDRGPRRPANRGDVAIQEMPRIRQLLRVAEREGTVRPAGPRRELWATEFWWESNPPADLSDYPVPSERGQARNIADALRLLWKQRIPVALLFQVHDDETVGLQPRTGWGTGIVFADGERKLAFTAARFPFVADRVSKRRVSVWARSPVRGKLKFVVRGRRGKTRTVKTARARPGQVITRRVRLRKRARLWARVGGERSLSWRVPKRRITR